MQNQLPIHGLYAEWEREEVARREQSDRLKELFKRAKGEGYNAKALRQAFAEQFALDHFTGDKLAKRSADASDVDLYLAALAGVRTREIIEEIPPHDADGVILEADPRHGAGGTEEEASVATYGAASSDNSSQDIERDSHPLPDDVPCTSPAGVEGEADRQPIPAETPNEKVGGFPVPAAPLSRGGTGGQDQAENMIDDRGGEDPPPPASTTVVTLQLRTHNPETHFLNSHGLERLHGCQNPEVCGSGQPLVRLCFRCSVQHDGPTHGEAVA